MSRTGTFMEISMCKSLWLPIGNILDCAWHSWRTARSWRPVNTCARTPTLNSKANGFARSTDSARAPLKSVGRSSLPCGSVKLRKLSGQVTQFEPPLMESWVQLNVVDGDCRLLESNRWPGITFTAANRPEVRSDALVSKDLKRPAAMSAAPSCTAARSASR